jgi:hypothetical protein
MTVGHVAPRPPFHHQDFDPDLLAETRWALGKSISVCLPARNEAPTVGSIVERIRRDLVERRGLVDEVIVLDDGSTDHTARVAGEAGAQVVSVEDVLPELGPGYGKGDVLGTSLFVSHGDLVCWVDADIQNFDGRFVTGLLGPLVMAPDVDLVKGSTGAPPVGGPRRRTGDGARGPASDLGLVPGGGGRRPAPGRGHRRPAGDPGRSCRSPRGGGWSSPCWWTWCPASA